MPDPKVIRDIVIHSNSKQVDVQRLLSKINRRIEILFDREHTIGHAFFVGLQDGNDGFKNLEIIFKEKIFSLLQEYFHADYRLIMMVLGIPVDNTDVTKFISISEINDTDIEFDTDDKLPSVLYQINEKAFSDINNYISIYEN